MVVMGRGKVNQNGEKRGEKQGIKGERQGRTKSRQCSTPLTRVIPGD